MTTITDLDDFKALDPFFRIIEKGLDGIADGGHFFDLLAEEVIFEYIITTPGYPRRVEGRPRPHGRRRRRVRQFLLPGRGIDSGADAIAELAQLVELGRGELIDDELSDAGNVAGRASDELGVARFGERGDREPSVGRVWFSLHIAPRLEPLDQVGQPRGTR